MKCASGLGTEPWTRRKVLWRRLLTSVCNKGVNSIRKKGICEDFVVVRGKGLVLYNYIMYCSEYLEHLTYLVNNDLRWLCSLKSCVKYFFKFLGLDLDLLAFFKRKIYRKTTKLWRKNREICSFWGWFVFEWSTITSQSQKIK